ncbi:MAG: hypothetical protein ACE5JD_11160 [Candidatus Methylomirabilia bacterium]
MSVAPPPGPTPTLHAMLVCDTIITDGETGKASLIGIFDQLTASKLPGHHPGFAVYVRLGDAQGTYIFRLELVHLDTDRFVGRTITRPVQVTERTKSHDLRFRLHNVDFHEPGLYEFSLFANDQFVGSRGFHVVIDAASKKGDIEGK